MQLDDTNERAAIIETTCGGNGANDQKNNGWFDFGGEKRYQKFYD